MPKNVTTLSFVVGNVFVTIEVPDEAKRSQRAKKPAREEDQQAPS